MCVIWVILKFGTSMWKHVYIEVENCLRALESATQQWHGPRWTIHPYGPGPVYLPHGHKKWREERANFPRRFNVFLHSYSCSVVQERIWSLNLALLGHRYPGHQEMHAQIHVLYYSLYYHGIFFFFLVQELANMLGIVKNGSRMVFLFCISRGRDIMRDMKYSTLPKTAHLMVSDYIKEQW